MLLASIVVSVCLLLLAVGAYLRDVRREATPGAARPLLSLLTLRLASIVVLFTVLSGLVIRHSWSRPGRVVAVLVDVSRSMGFGGADSAARRAMQVLLPTFGSRVSRFVFAETTVTADDAFRPRAGTELGRNRTRMGVALASVLRQQPGAVLLLSDGRDNGTLDPVQVAARAGVRVYTVGCGARQLENLSLEELRIPEDVYAGETTRVSVRLGWSGAGPTATTVEVGGQTRELRFEGAGSQEVVTGAVFSEPGFHLLRAEAESVPGEVSAADNVLERMVWVRPGRVRVRYISDAPGPSSRFMTRALQRLPRVTLRADVVSAATGPGSLEGARPDVYVLDGLRAGSDWPGWERVIGDVRAGSGVLVLTGTGVPVGHPLERIVPGGGDTRRGPVHAAAEPGSPLAELAAFIDRLPPLESALIPARPDSFEPWLVDAGDGAVLAGERLPPGPAGRGRVLYVGGSLWRWGFPGTASTAAARAASVAGAPTVLERVLEKAVRFLAGVGEEPLQLAPVRPVMLAGDPVELELSAMTADGRPLTGAAPKAALRVLEPSAHGEDDGEGELGDELEALPMVEQSEGRYQVRFSSLPPGSYEAVVVLAEEQVRASFVVSDRSREDLLVGLDDRALRELARATGGRYFDSESLPRAGFEPELAPSRYGFEFTPRRSVWAYLLLVVLAGCEWLLRRRKGMA